MQELQLPTPEQIKEAQERSKKRLQDSMRQAQAEQGRGPDDEDDEDDDEDDEDEGTDEDVTDVDAALATISKSPHGLARLKEMLGIKEDKFAVTNCHCPQCVFEGEPGSKNYRPVRQFHWFCYVCGGGPYVWQLTQPPYIKPISRNGVIGEAHYCCGSACQSRYESRFGLKQRSDYVPEGTYTSQASGVVAR